MPSSAAHQGVDPSCLCVLDPRARPLSGLDVLLRRARCEYLAPGSVRKLSKPPYQGTWQQVRQATATENGLGQQRGVEGRLRARDCR
jgi:hypothetical protein